MIRGLGFAVFAACCGAPGTLPESTEAPPQASATVVAPAPAPIGVTVRERIGDRWEVTYRFAEPVRGVAFERGQHKFRAERWSIAADGGASPARWTEIEGREAIVVSGGGAMRELSIALTTDTDEKPSDYLVHAAFSEGSRLFYTGHFALRPVACPGEEACAETALSLAPTLEPSDLAWHFITDAERDVQVLERRAAGELDWAPVSGEHGMGTYVYFGNLPIEDVGFGPAIVDPGLPSWMRRMARELAPKLVDWYAKETGAKLSIRPLVLIARKTSDASGIRLKGGVLPGLLQIMASGAELDAETPGRRRLWAKHLAHEIFHLWNGERFQRRDRGREGWLSEGSSEYFAWRALLALGEIDDATFSDWIVDATNGCLIAIGSTALAGSSIPTGVEYTCGGLAWVLGDAIARSKGQTIAGVLGRVFAKAAASDGLFGTEDVLAELRALAGDAPLGTLEALLLTGFRARADELILEELQRAGVKASLVAPSKARIEGKPSVVLAGSELARCDCRDGRISLSVRSDHLFFHDVPECATLRGVRVQAIAGRSVPIEAAAVYDHLVARSPKTPLVLRLDGKKEPLVLKCREDYEGPPFKKLFQ